MLSRDHVGGSSAAEGRQATDRSRRPPSARDLLARARGGRQVVLLVVAAGLLGAFVWLNRGAVVEPRVHLVFFQSQRPALLMVLLLAACGGALVALLARSALHTMSHRPDMRMGAAAAPAEATDVPAGAPRPA